MRTSAALAHRAVQAHVFRGDGMGLGEQCVGCRDYAHIALRVEFGAHAIERPVEVDCRGTACGERIRA
jgi:hypothetical protein